MSLRNYSDTAPPITLTVDPGSGGTTLTVASTTGYPAAPFLIGIERGTANEEVVLCTAKSGTTFTVTRGYDGTTAVAHAIGSSVEHCVAGIDYREGNSVAGTFQSYREVVNVRGNVTGAQTIDYSLGNIVTYTLIGNVTFTISNLPASGNAATVTIFLTQDATAGRTITWPAGVKWAGGNAPGLSGANKTDVVSLLTLDGGSNYYGFVGGLNF